MVFLTLEKLHLNYKIHRNRNIFCYIILICDSLSLKIRKKSLYLILTTDNYRKHPNIQNMKLFKFRLMDINSYKFSLVGIAADGKDAALRVIKKDYQECVVLRVEEVQNVGTVPSGPRSGQQFPQ